jgi:hypothetical protein
VAILLGRAFGPTLTPAPRVTTRVATSSWSRPIGTQTIGTPWARAFIAVPCPQCVIATAACSSTSRCGAVLTTCTFGGAATSAGSISGPVVITPRTGSVPSASAIRRRTASWSM